MEANPREPVEQNTAYSSAYSDNTQPLFIKDLELQGKGDVGEDFGDGVFERDVLVLGCIEAGAD